MDRDYTGKATGGDGPRVRTGAGGMDVEDAVTGGDGTETGLRADL